MRVPAHARVYATVRGSPQANEPRRGQQRRWASKQGQKRGANAREFARKAGHPFARKREARRRKPRG